MKRHSLNRRGRCVICGRFYSEPTPDDSACADHIYDYNRQREQQATAAAGLWAALRRSLPVSGAQEPKG